MSKHKIMIVDDDRMSLRMSEHILSGKYETVCANCVQRSLIKVVFPAPFKPTIDKCSPGLILIQISSNIFLSVFG